MNLRPRLARLERNRPDPFTDSGQELDLCPDICARIFRAQAAGTFPQSLADADLEAIVAAGDVTRGQK